MASAFVSGVEASSVAFFVSAEGDVHIEYSITEDPDDTEADQVTLFLDLQEAEKIINDLTEAMERCKVIEDSVK